LIVTEDPIEIIDIKGEQVKVRAIRLPMCAHCHFGSAPQELFEFWVEDKIGVAPNDLVQLGMSSRHFLLTVALVFGLPLFGLLGGILLGYALYPHLPYPLTPLLWESLFGLAGLGLSLLGLHRFDRYASLQPGFLPSVIKKVRVKPELLALKGQEIPGGLNYVTD